MDGSRGNGRPRKMWLDVIGGDIKEYEVNALILCMTLLLNCKKRHFDVRQLMRKMNRLN